MQGLENLEEIVDKTIAASPKQIQDYLAGKEKAFNSLVGQVMKTAKGASPSQVNDMLRRKLLLLQLTARSRYGL